MGTGTRAIAVMSLASLSSLGACGEVSESPACFHCVDPERPSAVGPSMPAGSDVSDAGRVGDAAPSSDAGSGSGGPEGDGGRADRSLGENPVLLQGFYWDVPYANGATPWWSVLRSRVSDFSSLGIDAVWIPPPYKGKGVADVGYGVYDRFDLGEFDQRGTVRTRYGTLAELDAMIATFHAAGIGVHADIVMNHALASDGTETLARDGGTLRVPTRFDFPGRGTKYSAFAWNSTRFNGCNTASGWVSWSPWDFAPYADGDAWDNLLGCEIRYSDVAVQDEMIAWGKWITARLSLDGYRLDATKHMLTSFVNRWLDEVRGDRFAVSEAWFGNLANLRAYAKDTARRTRLFDVPLHYAFQAMSQGDGAWDMRGLVAAGLAGVDPALAVTFVDNHDTDAPSGALRSPIVNFKEHAYAYILVRETAIPMLYVRDLYDYGHMDAVKKLVELRRAHAHGPGHENPASDADTYVYTRDGDASHAGLVLVLSDGATDRTKRVGTRWKSTRLVDGSGRHGVAVTTDATGTVVLPVAARSVAVWTPSP
ncbi:MAG: alpha-amylase domain-containing protein [Polyangiaceae bacterium]